jgi:hypothetical protein
MDDIISKFENLSTNSNSEIDDDLDIGDLILKINNLDIDNYFEWNRLTENYNKLKHFKNIIDTKLNKKLNTKLNTKLKVPFVTFMEKIDTINKYYIDNINLDPDHYTTTDGYNMYDLSSIRDIIEIIFSSLKKSIKSNNPNTKLDYVLIAYSNIMLLLDDLKGEQCVKKRKCN